MKMGSATTAQSPSVSLLQGSLYSRHLPKRPPIITKEEVLGVLDHSDAIIIDVRSRGGELRRERSEKIPKM